jgi:DNA-3-methyladenine glycosylase II
MSDVHTGMVILSEKDSLLQSIIKEVGVCGLCQQDDRFQYLIKSIIGQQLSITAARSINLRIDLFFSSKYDPYIFSQTSEQTLKELGISKRKASYIYDLCNKIILGDLDLNNLSTLNNEDIIHQLIKVKGIGTWTAKMFLIFVLARTNVFPLEDLTFKNQLIKLYHIQPTQVGLLKEIQDLWHPYESIAAWYLWRHKDNQQQKST